MATTDFKVNFDSDTSEIDVNTLITSLVGLSTTIQEIQNKISPDNKIEIKVKAIEKGSFFVFLGIHSHEILGAIQNIFTRENITLTAAILTALVHSITLKKHLAGKAPKSIEQNPGGQTVSVENENGQVIIVNTTSFHLYQNTPALERNLSRTFSAIDSEENVTSFEITDSEDKPLISIPREHFSEMAIVNEEATSNLQTITKKNVHIQATKLYFEPGNKWSFIYEGNKINAHVSDERFFELINKGQRFAKGDTLIVDLDIHQEFDETVNAYLNKSYTVVHVENHIPRPEQLTLGLPSEEE